METLLTYIDIFGWKYSFRLDNRDNFTTPLGGVLTILTLLIIFIFTFFFGQDFYYGTNPNIYYNTIIPEKYDNPLRLDQKNFHVAWRIENYTKSIVDFDKIIYPLTKYFRVVRNDQGSIGIAEEKIIPNKRCNENLVFTPEFIKYNKIEDWYCYDWTSANFTFGGFFDGDFAHFFQTILYVCQNGVDYSSQNNNCTKFEDYENFDRAAGGLQISVLYPQYYFVPDDLNDPLRITYKNYYYYFNLRTFKIDRFFFQKISLNDDRGWIFEDIKTKSIISYNRMSMDQNINEIRNSTSSQFYEMNFYMEKSSQVIKRSYMKIQDVSAKVGGFMKIIITIFSVVNMIFSSYNFQKRIFHEIFVFPKQNNSEEFKEEEKRIPKIFDLDKSMKNNFLNKNELMEESIKIKELFPATINDKKKTFTSNVTTVNKNYLRNENNDKNSNINFSFFMKYKSMFCRKNLKGSDKKKLEAFDFLNNYFDKRLDLINYIKYLNSIDKMRFIFLNKHQNYCLNVIDKPNIFDKGQMQSLGLLKEIGKEKQADEIINYFKSKISNQTLNYYDKKLYSILPKKIQDLISKN